MTTEKRGQLGRKRLGKRIYEYRYIYLLALPGFLYFLLFKILPMWGVALSFENFKVSKGVFGSEFVGLKNYINFFKNRNFLKMFRNTLAISSLNLFLGFPLPILLAILLNEIRNQKYKKTMQTLVYLPHFMSWVVVAGLFDCRERRAVSRCDHFCNDGLFRLFLSDLLFLRQCPC